MPRAKSIYSTGSRKRLTLCFAVLLILVLLFTRIPAILEFPSITILGLIGLLFTALGAFGRVWSSIYIAGRKNKELVDEGPYSVTRNPLYLFSLLGATGLGLASCNPVVLVCLLAGFLLYYPGVIAAEEEKLRAKHGENYEEYRSRVPRVLPDFSLFAQPEQISLSPGPATRAFADAVWFILGYIGLRTVVWLHAFTLLPALEVPFF